MILSIFKQLDQATNKYRCTRIYGWTQQLPNTAKTVLTKTEDHRRVGLHKQECLERNADFQAMLESKGSFPIASLFQQGGSEHPVEWCQGEGGREVDWKLIPIACCHFRSLYDKAKPSQTVSHVQQKAGRTMVRTMMGLPRSPAAHGLDFILEPTPWQQKQIIKSYFPPSVVIAQCYSIELFQVVWDLFLWKIW